MTVHRHRRAVVDQLARRAPGDSYRLRPPVARIHDSRGLCQDSLHPRPPVQHDGFPARVGASGLIPAIFPHLLIHLQVTVLLSVLLTSAIAAIWQVSLLPPGPRGRHRGGRGRAGGQGPWWLHPLCTNPGRSLATASEWTDATRPTSLVGRTHSQPAEDGPGAGDCPPRLRDAAWSIPPLWVCPFFSPEWPVIASGALSDSWLVWGPPRSS